MSDLDIEHEERNVFQNWVSSLNVSKRMADCENLYHNYRNLALKVCFIAIQDACRGNRSSLLWLKQTGIEWLHLLGIEVTHEMIEEVIQHRWRAINHRARVRIDIERKQDLEIVRAVARSYYRNCDSYTKCRGRQKKKV